MRTFYRIPMLVFMLLTQVTMLMAQGNKPENVPTSVYGTYQGEATTEITNDKGTTKGAKKQLKIEISKGENGYTVLTLKDFSVGQYSFDNIPFKNCLLLPKDNNKWQIYLSSNIYGDFTTKDGVYTLRLEGRIYEENSFVSEDGTLYLDFGIFYSDTKIEHLFKGKKENGTTGINKLTQQSGKQTMYDLQGRRVEQPSKGIYVVNGKKIVY